MARYLVTGGCGFIGSHLVESLLADGHYVRIIDNLSSGSRDNVPHQCELHIDDISNPNSLDLLMDNIDGCFHLAAIASVELSNKNWIDTHNVNLTGTIRVFDAARKNKTPVVYASSAAVYGNNKNFPLTEKNNCKPLTAYGADKLGCELHGKVAGEVHGVPNTGLRFFNVYGPRQNPSSPYSGVISIFADKISNKQKIQIFGDGEQSRDFIYVKDVIRFLRVAMTHASTNANIYNVCQGKSISVNQLATILMSISGNNVNVEYNTARKGDIVRSIGCPQSANRELKVVTEISIENGLTKLLNHKEKLKN